MTIARDDFLLVKWWMVEELGLRGNELLIYSLIWSFSRAEEQRFYGSIEYIMKWTGASKRTVYYVLNSLLEKGLIIKDEEEYHEHVFAYYRANLELLNKGAAGGEEEKEEADPPVKQERAKKKEKEEKEEKEREKLFSEFANQFSFVEHTREDLISTLNDFVEARKEGKDPMKGKAYTILLNRLAKYAGSDGDLAIEILETSILNGWAGVFEPKKNSWQKRAPERRPAPSPDPSSDELADLTAKLAEMGYKWNEAKGAPEPYVLKEAIGYNSALNSYLADGYVVKI